MNMRSPRSRGFSLIEILVATGIVVAALIGAEVLVHTLSLSRMTHYEDVALVIARGELENVRSLGYGSVPASGAFSSSLLASLPSGTGALTVSDWNAGTKRITVTVSWQTVDGSAARSLVLSTLITKTGGLP